MGIDTWSLVVSLVLGLTGAVVGAVAAWYGFKSFRASKAQLEIARSQAKDSKEQLELARDQASQVPRIELMEMSGHPLSDNPELRGDVREARREMNQLQKKRHDEERAERAREERERREREEREKREREEQQKREQEERERTRGFNAETAEQMEGLNLADLFKSMAEPLKPLVDYTSAKPLADFSSVRYPSVPDLRPPKFVYEGPLPNYYLDVGIRNVGRAAAYDVTGWVWFDKGVLEPVEQFAEADVTVAGERHGKVKVELRVLNEGGRLFPSHNDPYTFRIPLLVHKTVDTSIEYEFTSPQGEPAHGEFNLLLASGGQQE